MPEKDKWDKFEVTSKFIGAVVLVAIPIVIKYGADSISQSMQRGQLIQSLTTQLVERDAKRDIALIALDAAIPSEKDKCTMKGCQSDLDSKRLHNDQVLKIADVLVSRSIEDARKKIRSLDTSDIKIAKEIIISRTDEKYYTDKYKEGFDSVAAIGNPTSDKSLASTPQEKEVKAQVSEVLSALQPPRPQTTSSNPPSDSDLAGIRLVYIQYQSNKKQAEKLQQDLKAVGISVPGIEKVKEIEENDIRYANAVDKQIAEKLQDYLEKNQGIKIEKLIDLSTAKYGVSSGQVEIWLK